MEFLILWILTIIISIIMETKQELQIAKDIADAGYKIDIKRMNEFTEQVRPNQNKINLLTFLLPIVNICVVAQRQIQYNNMKPMIIDQLQVLDCIDSMSKEEQEEYEKNPTGFHAITMCVANTLKPTIPEDAIKITIVYENQNSTVYYTNRNQKIEIIDIEGALLKRPPEEAAKVITNAITDKEFQNLKPMNERDKKKEELLYLKTTLKSLENLEIDNTKTKTKK